MMRLARTLMRELRFMRLRVDVLVVLLGLIVAEQVG